MNIKDNSIKKNKHIISILLIMGICIIGFLLVYIVNVKPISKITSYETIINANGDNIVSGAHIKQTFKTKENIYKIKIKFNNLKNENNGDIIVKLINEDDSQLNNEWKAYASEISGNEYYEFTLDNPIKDLEKVTGFSVSIISDDEDIERSTAIQVSNRDNYKEGALYINNEKQDNDMCLKIVSKGSPFLNLIYITIAIILILFSGVLYYITISRKLPREKIFLISASIIGLIYTILMTPYSVSDESGHINTAYRYSNVLMGNGYETDSGKMLKREEDSKVYALSRNPTATTYNTVITHFFDKADESELVEVSGERIGNMWQYIPTAIGITIARLLKVGYIPLIYIGRLLNFIFYLGMIYWGMKKLPFGKITLFAVSMLPMALQQGASFSYDAIVYGLGYFYISYALYIAFSKEAAKRRDILFLVLSGGILSTCKGGVFIFICLTCLLIPINKFKNKKRYLAAIAIIVLAALSMFLIFNFVKVRRTIVTTEKPLVEFNSQVAYAYSYIFTNPLGFLKIVYNTIITNVDFYVLSTFGSHLGWSTIEYVEVPIIIIIVYIIIVILSAFREDGERQYISIKNKILMLAIIIMVCFTFFTAALTWTPYGDSTIFGLQGRYYLAVLPLIAFLFRNNTVILKRNLDKQIILAIGFLQIITLNSIFLNIIKI